MRTTPELEQNLRNPVKRIGTDGGPLAGLRFRRRAQEAAGGLSGIRPPARWEKSSEDPRRAPAGSIR